MIRHAVSHVRFDIYPDGGVSRLRLFGETDLVINMVNRMKTYRLNLKPLTREAFAPFGDVIQKQGHYPEEINYGQTRKYARLAGIDATR